MSNDIVTTTDAETGDTIVREMTAAEQKARNEFLAKVEADAITAQAEAEAAAVQKAAILTKLGITADELKIALS